MNIDFAKIVEMPYMKKRIPKIDVGDTVSISSVVRDAKTDKKRNQEFKGLVISMKNSGVRQTITVRKITDGVGVEKIFPIHSPAVSKISILKKGKVRQAKIFYMRDRIGKKAVKVQASGVPVEYIQLTEEEVKKLEVEETLAVEEPKAEEIQSEKVEAVEVAEVTEGKE